jgi:hypothetical protein
MIIAIKLRGFATLREQNVFTQSRKAAKEEVCFSLVSIDAPLVSNSWKASGTSRR